MTRSTLQPLKRHWIRDEPLPVIGFALMFGGALVAIFAVTFGASTQMAGGLWFLAAVVSVNLMGR